MAKAGRKRNAIHSGIGDNDDLLIKRPLSETGVEQFQYAARLRGKKKHETMIYPELPFQYGISYSGETLETHNEHDYAFNVYAHPEKNLAMRIEETKELPIKRMWEAKACFEAEVGRMNLEYAIKWEGTKKTSVQNAVDYAVSWRALVTSKSISDARSFFTSAQGNFIGYGNESTWKRPTGEYVEDRSNTSRFSGIIAKDYYTLQNYSAEFDFKTVLADNDQFAGGNDDDIVGLIFKARSKTDFYMMLWERDDRVKGSWRAPDNLEYFNMLTSGADKWEDRVYADGCNSSSSMSSSAWQNYCDNKGWRQKHRRIYRVKDGVMRRVDTTPYSGRQGYDDSVKDLGDGKGWDLNVMHSLKVDATGKSVQIYVKDGSWKKVFDFETDWAEGSFGLVNVSQAVQFHRISVQEKVPISGRIPDTGYDTTTANNKDLGRAYDYCIDDAKAAAQKVKYSGYPDLLISSIDFTYYKGLLKDSSKGTITSPIGDDTHIIVDAGSHTASEKVTGRINPTGWFSFNGIGDKTHAANALDYVKSKDTLANSSNVTVTSITGEVKDPRTGNVIVNGLTGSIIAHNNNPLDVGQKYSKCYIECGIVEVTPDNRTYDSALLVFADIATVFKRDYDEFFNRPEYINKKTTYELLKPVQKEKPKPPEAPPTEISEGGCIIEDPVVNPPEGPIDECFDDFDFDGKKLVMWNCEFPIVKTEKLFEYGVFAYQGIRLFDPLVEFTSPNKWTSYELKPIEATINPTYDTVKWVGRDELKGAPVGTRVLVGTKEWYKAIFPADIINEGLVVSERDLISDIPPCPEHFFHPVNTTERMPDSFDVVHFLLDAFDNHRDVVMWYESDPSITTENVNKSVLAQEGRKDMPILYTGKDTDRIVIHCKPDPRYIPWTSGKYIGYGKVNGQRPFFTMSSGKADMVDVPTEVVFFPDNLVAATLQGPFVDVYDEGSPNAPRVTYTLSGDKKTVDFSSNYISAYNWVTDWYSNWVEDNTTYLISTGEIKEITNTVLLDPTIISSDYNPATTVIEGVEVNTNNPFVTAYIGELNLPDYTVKAQVKKARPMPWSPMIHNGYYYHEEREHYLYAEKIVVKQTPDANHSVTISPRPQQGSAMIVRDNLGNNLRKVAFYDEFWRLTLENTETLTGNGYAKYYLNYKGIDKATLKVLVNGVELPVTDYIFHEEESSVEFMKILSQNDKVIVKYKLLYSYYVDMNADVHDGLVASDTARIVLHSNYDVNKMTNMEIIYESSKETPFYRGNEVAFNPLLNHNHTGFLYLTETTEQDVKDIRVNLSDKTLSNNTLEKVLLTVVATDKYNNPCPNKVVKITRDGILIDKEFITNTAGEVYFYDQPVPTSKLVSVYHVECEGITRETLLNYYVDKQPERYYVELTAQKTTVMAGLADEAVIAVTLRDPNWNLVASGTLNVSIIDSYGVELLSTTATNVTGQALLNVSGLSEQAGEIIVKVSYDMGFEVATNQVVIKVIGG